MMTHLIAITILALAFGALWHKQPPKGNDHEHGEPSFLPGRLVNRALAWLVLAPHISNPTESREQSDWSDLEV